MKLTLKSKFIIGAILVAAFSRLIPHPMNFTPIGAMALMGAAYFDRKAFAFLVPAASMFISDLFINNLVYPSEGFVLFGGTFIPVVGAFMLIALMGTYTLRKIKLDNVLLSSIGASAIFFLVSNFGSFIGSPMYTKDFAGLMYCYEMAIPFFGNTIAGDLVYTGILFGAMELAKMRFPRLAAA